ncbi:MarR family winged helix-turn-helix transcriptional regulator [Arsenicicoccus dermatophilus]|uniref:MarR family winged helix-turn-helix transcriptional regulator n=1 Tax=Arsenicicoccus dermatophilus TaxID=1076331 RepID=UPI003916E266
MPELDFWSFVRLARTRLVQEGFADARASELLLTLNRASGIVTYDLEASVHRPAGRSWSAFRILYVLWLAGALEPRRVAELTGLTRAAVSNLVGPLVDQGVVWREPAPDDRRSVRLGLTGAGVTEIRCLFEAQHQREIAWAAALSEEEQRTLTGLLDKLVGGRDDLVARLRH